MPASTSQHQPSPASPVHYCSAAHSNRRVDNEALVPQQTLFSWGAFMAEESVKPKGPEPQAPDRRVPFDWTLSLQQEREKELVSGGR